jgi:signal transduction histidine kinase
LPPEGLDELRRQSNAVKKMNAMLDEILKLSRLSRQEFHPQSVDLTQLAKDAADGVSVPSTAKLSFEGPMLVEADRQMMVLALRHLIENAVKFAEPGRPLCIELYLDGQDVCLRDNGIGIEPNQISRVFLPFERLNGDRFPGAGMGLPTVKRVLERHEAAIALESQPGLGTTVRLRLRPVDAQ